jgi:hypothetical protein
LHRRAYFYETPLKGNLPADPAVQKQTRHKTGTTKRALSILKVLA